MNVFYGCGVVLDVPVTHCVLDVVLDGMAVGANQAMVGPDGELELVSILQLPCVPHAIALKVGRHS